MREYVIKCYQEAVTMLPYPQELKDSLLIEERVPAFIDNLYLEFVKVPKVSRETIQSAVYDMTDLLMRSVKTKFDEDQMSMSARSAIIAANEQATKIDRLANRINEAPDHSPASIDMEELLDG